MPHNCPVCRGTGLVSAYETTRGWVCEGLNGDAKCNRPKRIALPKFKKGRGNVRSGEADCPLCAERKLRKSHTEEHGYPSNMFEIDL